MVRARLSISSRKPVVFVIVKRRGHFGPDDDRRRMRCLDQRAAQGEMRQLALHAVDRFRGPLLRSRRCWAAPAAPLPGRAARAGRGGRKPETAAAAATAIPAAGGAEQASASAADIITKTNERPVNAGDGREAQRKPHVDSRIAQRQPGKAQRAVRDFHRHPQRRHRRHGPPAAHQDAGQQREHPHVQAPWPRRTA